MLAPAAVAEVAAALKALADVLGETVTVALPFVIPAVAGCFITCTLACAVLELYIVIAVFFLGSLMKRSAVFKLGTSGGVGGPDGFGEFATPIKCGGGALGTLLGVEAPDEGTEAVRCTGGGGFGTLGRTGPLCRREGLPYPQRWAELR